MRRIIFYSWQSDLPNACNRGFIQAALEEAVTKIATDDTIAVEPVVDRDTLNVPGSPDIASTIFSKITGADIFVADVSIVARAQEMRPTPNPNVLIELGYALKALGHERIILVFNRSFGKAEDLPFDLRMRRVLVYEMPKDAKERASERAKLAKRLEEALRAALVAVPEIEPPAAPAVTAIENSEPRRRIVLRRNLEEILKKLDACEPKKPRDGGTVDELVAGIGSTQETVAEFSKIAETITVIKDGESAEDVYRWFGKLFDRYTLPDGYNGPYSEADQDFFKFVGHEMFITLFGYLMRERRWDIIHRLIDEPIVTRTRRGIENVTWEYASQHLAFLIHESPKRQRISLHGDLLKERHGGTGGLATIAPLQDLMDADFFFFLLSRIPKDNSGFDLRYWRAWSCLNLKQPPAFVRNSERMQYAQNVATLLNLPNVDEYKRVLAERGPDLAKLFQSGWWDYPIQKSDVDKIGTR
jgi:hypothetical protein